VSVCGSGCGGKRNLGVGPGAVVIGCHSGSYFLCENVWHEWVDGRWNRHRMSYLRCVWGSLCGGSGQV